MTTRIRVLITPCLFGFGIGWWGQHRYRLTGRWFLLNISMGTALNPSAWAIPKLWFLHRNYHRVSFFGTSRGHCPAAPIFHYQNIIHVQINLHTTAMPVDRFAGLPSGAELGERQDNGCR